MPLVTYIEHSGARHQVEVRPGGSAMEGAVKANVPGIVAECGGACACATCHVFVDPAWAEQVGQPGAAERDMLDFAEGVAANSRLACQIRITETLDGLIVRMPERQV